MVTINCMDETLTWVLNTYRDKELAIVCGRLLYFAGQLSRPGELAADEHTSTSMVLASVLVQLT